MKTLFLLLGVISGQVALGHHVDFATQCSQGVSPGSISSTCTSMTISPKEIKTTCRYTGGQHIVRAPFGASKVYVRAWGAGGGADMGMGNNPGGPGGLTRGYIQVESGDQLSVIVGQGGYESQQWSFGPTPFGFGGPVAADGSGGGLSGVFSGAGAVGAGSFSRALLIAGGGGGTAASDKWGHARGLPGGSPGSGGMGNMQGVSGGGDNAGGGGGYRGGGNSGYAGKGGSSYTASEILGGTIQYAPNATQNPPTTTDYEYGAGLGGAPNGGNGLVTLRWQIGESICPCNPIPNYRNILGTNFSCSLVGSKCNYVIGDYLCREIVGPKHCTEDICQGTETDEVNKCYLTDTGEYKKLNQIPSITAATLSGISSTCASVKISDTEIRTTCHFRGYDQRVTPPAGAYEAVIKAWGAGGGFDVRRGGPGGFAQSTVLAQPMTIMVGEGGRYWGMSGYGFGGFSRRDGSGGGLSGAFSGTAAIHTGSHTRALTIGAGGGGSGGNHGPGFATGRGGGSYQSLTGNMKGLNITHLGDSQGSGGGGGYRGGSHTTGIARVASGGQNFGDVIQSSPYGSYIPPNTGDPDYISPLGQGSSIWYNPPHGLVVIRWKLGLAPTTSSGIPDPITGKVSVADGEVCPFCPVGKIPTIDPTQPEGFRCSTPIKILTPTTVAPEQIIAPTCIGLNDVARIPGYSTRSQASKYKMRITKTATGEIVFQSGDWKDLHTINGYRINEDWIHLKEFSQGIYQVDCEIQYPIYTETFTLSNTFEVNNQSGTSCETLVFDRTRLRVGETTQIQCNVKNATAPYHATGSYLNSSGDACLQGLFAFGKDFHPPHNMSNTNCFEGFTHKKTSQVSPYDFPSSANTNTFNAIQNYAKNGTYSNICIANSLAKYTNFSDEEKLDFPIAGVTSASCGYGDSKQVFIGNSYCDSMESPQIFYADTYTNLTCHIDASYGQPTAYEWKLNGSKVSSGTIESGDTSISTNISIPLGFHTLECLITGADNANYVDPKCRTEVNTQQAPSGICITGDSTLNASICPGDDQGIGADVPVRVTNTCSRSRKCEYRCNTGYVAANGSCITEATYGEPKTPSHVRTYLDFPLVACSGGTQDKYFKYQIRRKGEHETNPECYHDRFPYCLPLCLDGYSYNDNGTPNDTTDDSCEPTCPADSIGVYPNCRCGVNKIYLAASNECINPTCPSNATGTHPSCTCQGVNEIYQESTLQCVCATNHIRINNICISEAASWQTSAWTTCSKPCEGGTQSRTVECRRDADNALVDESYCTDTKPASSQACNTQSCGFTNADLANISNTCTSSLISPQEIKTVCNHTGSDQFINAPTDSGTALFKAWGAGGEGHTSMGGAGGYTEGIVISPSSYTVVVGEGGGQSGTAAYGGGGGGNTGNRGGGLSGIFNGTSPMTFDSSGQTRSILIAGGGGASAHLSTDANVHSRQSGTAGGGLSAQPAVNASNGQPGTQVAGGSANAGCIGGSAGSALKGGTGSANSALAVVAPSGGGGYFGGGGGCWYEYYTNHEREYGSGGGSGYCGTTSSCVSEAGVGRVPPRQSDVDYSSGIAVGANAQGVGGNGLVIIHWKR